MNKKQVLQLFLIIGLAAVLVFVLTIAANPAQVGENAGEEQSREVKEEGTILLSIDGLYESKEVQVEEGEMVLAMLKKLNAEDPELALITKEYEGLGTLVEGMGGVLNGSDGKYWQYEVNGVMPQIGAGEYALQDGDRVVWKFKESEF